MHFPRCNKSHSNSFSSFPPVLELVLGFQSAVSFSHKASLLRCAGCTMLGFTVFYMSANGIFKINSGAVHEMATLLSSTPTESRHCSVQTATDFPFSLIPLPMVKTTPTTVHTYIHTHTSIFLTVHCILDTYIPSPIYFL